jgi:hypothetical protein
MKFSHQHPATRFIGEVMKNPRHIEVKTRMSDEEHRALSEACNEADVSHSKLLRDLALDWIRQRQSIESATKEKRPNQATKWAQPAANSRWNFGATPVRPRI